MNFKKPRKQIKKFVYVLRVSNNYDWNDDDNNGIDIKIFNSEHALYRYIDHEFTQDSEASQQFISDKTWRSDEVAIDYTKDEIITERNVRTMFNI